jgi:IS5 family transposase
VINGYGDRGLSLRQGTIVDATLIHAPSSTKNQDGKRDPEMHQTKKNQYYFGMKAHIGVDDESGWYTAWWAGSQRGGCHPGRQTAAATRTSSDAGYTGVEKRPNMLAAK